MILTLIQATIFISYVTFLMIKFKGPLPSISESWYRLDGLYKSLFTWFCWGIGFLMLYQTNTTTPFFFLSGMGLCFVGAATMFRSFNKNATIIHFTGAVFGILFSLAGLYFERHTILPFVIFLFISSLLYLFKIKNRTWWIEIAAFASIIYGLLCY